MIAEEVKEIQTTWAIPAATPTDSGVAILTAFFTKYPSNLQKFASFKDIPVSELKTNARFRTHAIRIIKVFDESIQSLGKDESGNKLTEMWSNIARTHFSRQIEKQAFNELREVILEVLTEVCKLNDEQKGAWTKLLDTVYTIVFNTLDKLKGGEL